MIAMHRCVFWDWITVDGVPATSKSALMYSKGLRQKHFNHRLKRQKGWRNLTTAILIETTLTYLPAQHSCTPRLISLLTLLLIATTTPTAFPSIVLGHPLALMRSQPCSWQVAATPFHFTWPYKRPYRLVEVPGRSLSGLLWNKPVLLSSSFVPLPSSS